VKTLYKTLNNTILSNSGLFIHSTNAGCSVYSGQSVTRYLLFHLIPKASLIKITGYIPNFISSSSKHQVGVKETL
jgi:hypothetical protein